MPLPGLWIVTSRRAMGTGRPCGARDAPPPTQTSVSSLARCMQASACLVSRSATGLLADGDPPPARTQMQDIALWLYTSGTAGKPKAAMHRHGSLRAVCETYGRDVLAIGPGGRCLSVAKAFFAYGLGNSVLFP